ncbi:MAG: cold shock domain-containing protein [Anaerolineae bacterium]
MGRSRRNDTYKPPKPSATSSAPPAGRFADQLLTCQQCGRQFVFTVEQQRRRADLGLPLDPPALCPVCAPADYGAPVSEHQSERRAEPAPARVAPAAAASPSRTERAPDRAPSARRERPESGAGFTVRSLGHVKWYDEERGYGFIVDDETGEEYFVHQSALESGSPALFEGQAVEFEVTHRQKGPEAVYILTL